MSQIYQRIQNPYMPQGTALKTNSATLYAPGELGCAFYEQMSGYSFARMLLDSGATASTPTGAVAAGQLAFWKDRVNNIITNDKRLCDVGPTGAVNRVAGIFGLAVTAGNYCDIIIQGKGVSVASDSSGAAGDNALADTTAATARAIGAATPTTAAVSQIIGVITVAPANSLVTVDVNLGSFIP